MKKIIILSALLTLTAASAVFATDTRVLTMGNNNMLLLDEANVFVFPSRIKDWPNLAVAEFGSGDFSRLGMNWKFGEKKKTWYLGTYFHNNATTYPDIWVAPFYSVFNGPSYGANPIYIPYSNNSFMASNRRMDLIYGRKLGTTDFGFHFGIVHSSQRNDGTTTGLGNTSKDEASLGIYNLDFGITSKDGLLDLALGVEFMNFTNKATDTLGVAYDRSKSRGNHRVHFVGRRFYEYDKNYTFIPHLAISQGKYESDYFNGALVADSVTLDQTNKYTRTTLDLGWGTQYAPSSQVLVVMDIGFSYDKLKGEFTPETGASDEASMKTVSFPYFKLGIDAAVFRWMDIRLGATSYWDRTTLEDANNNDFFTNAPDNATYLGFGFHWGNLDVDTHTDPKLFLRGFDFINGADHGDDMNFRLSAAYEI